MFAENIKLVSDQVLLEGYFNENRFAGIRESVRAKVVSNCPRLFILECAGVTGFSGHALVNLAALIRELDSMGSRLILRNLSKQIQETVVDRLLADLIHPALAEPLQMMMTACRVAARRHAGRQSSVN